MPPVSPVNDLQHIAAKHQARKTNHPFSEAVKGGYRTQAPVPPLQVGDLVYVKSDRDKSRARDRYIILLASTANGVTLISSLAHNSGLHLTR